MKRNQDLVLIEFKKLVRNEFSDLPSWEFKAYYDQLVNALGVEKQIELLERASLTVNTVPPVPKSFKTLPIDVLAFMMRNVNNNTLRAWCKTESYLRNRCFVVVEKVASLRNEALDWESFLKRHAQHVEEFKTYAVEALTAMEIGKNVFERNRDVGFTDITFKQISDDGFVRIQDNGIQDNINVYIENKEIENIYGKRIKEWLGPALKEGIDYSYFGVDNNAREIIELLIFRLLQYLQLRVTDVSGERYKEYSSKKDDKHYVYKGMATVEFPRLACIICNQIASFACGNCQQRYYCGQECAQKDWKQTHQKICNKSN